MNDHPFTWPAHAGGWYGSDPVTAAAQRAADLREMERGGSIRAAAERLDATEDAAAVDDVIQATDDDALATLNHLNAHLRDGVEVACQRLGHYLDRSDIHLSDGELVEAVHVVDLALYPSRGLDRAFRYGQAAARTEAALKPPATTINPAVVKPGDRLMIVASSKTSDREMQELLDLVIGVWPDMARRLIVVNAEDVAVIEASEPADG